MEIHVKFQEVSTVAKRKEKCHDGMKINEGINWLSLTLQRSASKLLTIAQIYVNLSKERSLA